MPFKGIVEPEQLSMLCQALDEYCLAHGISDKEGRDHAAWLVMVAFSNGATNLDELRAALETEQRRQA